MWCLEKWSWVIWGGRGKLSFTGDSSIKARGSLSLWAPVCVHLLGTERRPGISPGTWLLFVVINGNFLWAQGQGDDSSKLPGSFLLHRLLGSCFLDLENVSSSNDLGVAVSLGAVLSLGCVGKGKARWTGPVCFCYYDPGMPSYCGKFKNKMSKQGNFRRLKEEAGGGFSVSSFSFRSP